jgi:hypothetical protein
MNRLAVCLPQTDTVRREYARSLAAMMLKIGNVTSGFEHVATVTGTGSLLPSVRQDIAIRAIEEYKSTHLLWIDADHSFPDDTLHRLMAHKRAWVGINATTRHTEQLRTTASTSKGEFVTSGRYDKGLERVHRMGFGIVLIEARVFEAIEKPWFLIEWNQHEDGTGSFRGEDVYFCDKAREAGFAPMVDHDLTKETTHIGSVGFHTTMLDEVPQ